MRLKISISSNQIPWRLAVKVNRSGMEKRGECGNDIHKPEKFASPEGKERASE